MGGFYSVEEDPIEEVAVAVRPVAVKPMPRGAVRTLDDRLVTFINVLNQTGRDDEFAKLLRQFGPEFLLTLCANSTIIASRCETDYHVWHWSAEYFEPVSDKAEETHNKRFWIEYIALRYFVQLLTFDEKERVDVIPNYFVRVLRRIQIDDVVANR